MSEDIQEQSDEHFDKISSDYDQLEFYGLSKTKWIVERAIDYLEIQDSETIVDLGGGCGDLMNEICIRKKVKGYCMDISINMLKVGREKHFQNKSLEFVHLPMDEISKFELLADKFIVVSAIHFIKEDNLQSFYETIYNKLGKSGKILMVTRREKVPNIPLIATIQKMWYSIPTKTIEVALAKAGFKVSTEERIYKYAITKSRWYEHMTKRFISTISTDVISDEQIQVEIKELDETLLKGKDIVEFDDICVFIVGSK
ncbi:hypothetical protein LOD99_15355 [Oopsacas minuta]|uniref:Methyltransferase domain-containing protein n=1 Tax=Oopsacas minuta TaxID=111878 RepID=A0AAV7KCY1_9METZ|nr:hypothetical protein LOD99_15355 [Oopsacas minuta]